MSHGPDLFDDGPPRCTREDGPGLGAVLAFWVIVALGALFVTIFELLMALIGVLF